MKIMTASICLHFAPKVRLYSMVLKRKMLNFRPVVETEIFLRERGRHLLNLQNILPLYQKYDFIYFLG